VAARTGGRNPPRLNPTEKRGPKSKRSPLDEENQKLRRQNQQLSEELRKAEIVIDIQKKVAALLGRPLCTDREPQL
jgi:cell shape-determining protein MreC